MLQVPKSSMTNPAQKLLKEKNLKSCLAWDLLERLAADCSKSYEVLIHHGKWHGFTPKTTREVIDILDNFGYVEAFQHVKGKAICLRLTKLGKDTVAGGMDL